MNCENFRGITLLSTNATIYKRILEKRLSEKIQDNLILFRKGHCTKSYFHTKANNRKTNNTEFGRFFLIH